MSASGACLTCGRRMSPYTVRQPRLRTLARKWDVICPSAAAPRARRAAQPPVRLARLAAACVAIFLATIGRGLMIDSVLERPGWRVNGAASPVTTEERARVARVIDGDTFEVAGGGRVRILNIDTAEMLPRAQCTREAELANSAKARLRRLVLGREVRLTAEGEDRDRFGRLLRRVDRDGAGSASAARDTRVSDAQGASGLS